MQQDNYSILDTLLYLFDHIVDEKLNNASINDMHQTLNEAGFAEKTITRAIDWLATFSERDHDGNFIQPPSRYSIRWYSPAEQEKISHKSRHFINQMTQLGVIEPLLREVIIEQLMALDENKLLLDEVMWVALMSIYHRPDKIADREWLFQLLTSENHQPH